MIRSLSLVFAAAVIALAPAWAQVDVSKGGRVNVSLTGLEGKDGGSAALVLKADLQHTLLINVTQNPSDKFVISGTVTGDGLIGKLVDNSSKTEVVNKTYSGGWRSAVHQFADDVTLATTGVQGFATSRVAFVSSATGKKELYVMDMDGGNIKKLTGDGSISASPAWSKDGSMIAYTSYKSGYPDVYVIRLAQSTRTRVAFFPGINSGPSFSPDDQKLALTLSKDGNPEIYVMPVNGGTPDRVTRTRGAETSPSWSPQGDRLVYTSDDRGSAQLFISSAAGGEPERLITNTLFASEPDWSPDGNLIAFTLRMAGKFQIATYDLAKRGTQQITTTGGEDPSWTRNSRHLIYANNGAIYILDTVTKQSAKIENGLANCSEPAVSR